MMGFNIFFNIIYCYIYKRSRKAAMILLMFDMEINFDREDSK
jgi:hypothetical protein